MLKMSKGFFFRKKVNFLGFSINKDGLSADDKNVEKVKQMPIPKNKRQVRRFLGLVGFLRKLILNFSIRAAILTDLLKKDAEFKWTDEHTASFEDLKQAVCEKPAVTFPDFSKMFILYCDASKRCVAGMIGLARQEKTTYFIPLHIS